MKNLLSKKEYEFLFNRTSDIIGMFDEAGKIVLLSPSFEKLVGWTAEETANRKFTDFVSPEFHGYITSVFNDIKVSRKPRFSGIKIARLSN